MSMHILIEGDNNLHEIIFLITMAIHFIGIFKLCRN
jgi:hypothetical protein